MKDQLIIPEEVSLKELWLVVLKNKFIIFFIVIIFAISSVIFAVQLPNLYRSEATLIASSDSSSNMSSLAGSLGGLASLAGVNLSGTTGNDNGLLAQEMLKSRVFLTDFVEKYNLLVPLIAADGVNESGTLHINPSLYDENTKKWVRDVVAPKPIIPSSEDIYGRFKNILTVTKNGKTGIVNISLEFFKPDIAQLWLSLLIDEINLVIKEKDMLEATNSIKYLNKVIETTTNSAMKLTFYQIIEEQTKTLLLTKIRDEYVFKSIDPANLPENKSAPKRALICIVTTIVGFICALMFVFIRNFVFLTAKEEN